MLIYDYVDPAVLTGFVREVPESAAYALERFLPNRERQDVETAWDEVEQTNRAAKFRTFDAETPIGKRDAVSRKRVALPPLGEKYVLDEYERLMLQRLNGGNVNNIVETIYNDAARGVRAIRARMELARGDVLTDGKFTLSGENGLTIEVDYGVPGGNLVAPAGELWTHADATPLADLLTWLDAYVALNGALPGAIVTSRAQVANLLQNEEIRTIAGSTLGVPSAVGRQQLNAILESRDIPTIVTYDARVDVDGVATRAIPANRVIFLPADEGDEIGTTEWGIPVEGLELATEGRIVLQDAPGIVAVNLKQGDPARVWTKATAVGMPVLRQPKKLLVATVAA